MSECACRACAARRSSGARAAIVADLPVRHERACGGRGDRSQAAITSSTPVALARSRAASAALEPRRVARPRLHGEAGFAPCFVVRGGREIGPALLAGAELDPRCAARGSADVRDARGARLVGAYAHGKPWIRPSSRASFAAHGHVFAFVQVRGCSAGADIAHCVAPYSRVARRRDCLLRQSLSAGGSGAGVVHRVDLHSRASSPFAGASLAFVARAA